MVRVVVERLELVRVVVERVIVVGLELVGLLMG